MLISVDINSINVINCQQKLEVSMTKSKGEIKILSDRLREIIYDENLKIKKSELLEATGCSRQTFALYEMGQREMKFSFIQKCFTFLKSKVGNNLNIQYFIDPDCKEKNISRIDKFENLNISFQGITNIAVVKNELIPNALNTLNVILANKKFPEFIGELTLLQEKNAETKDEQVFLQWQTQKLIINFFNNVIDDLTPPKKFDQEIEFFK